MKISIEFIPTRHDAESIQPELTAQYRTRVSPENVSYVDPESSFGAGDIRRLAGSPEFVFLGCRGDLAVA
jgi:hypothetical protein